MMERSGLTNIETTRCEKLRWKGMYIEAEWDPTIQHSNDGAFWCQHTFTCLGPDGKVKAAYSQEVSLQVGNEIEEVKAVFNLNSGLKPDAIQSFAVGLARGADTGPHPGRELRSGAGPESGLALPQVSLCRW